MEIVEQVVQDQPHTHLLLVINKEEVVLIQFLVQSLQQVVEVVEVQAQ